MAFPLRPAEPNRILARLDLRGCPVGPVLAPLQPRTDAERIFFGDWITPLAPHGGYNRPSCLEVVTDEATAAGVALAFVRELQERALITGAPEARDYQVSARVLPEDSAARPHNDRNDVSEAYVGVVFRVEDSRHYYLFAVEGRRRLVLYRRADDEWYALASQEVTLPEGYVTLDVALDGDGIRCECPELGVSFSATDTTFPAGRAGVRALGRARVDGITISAAPWQARRNARRIAAAREEEAALSAAVPDPVLVRTLDLGALGGAPRFIDFAVPGRFDMLIATDTALRAATLEGETLWEIPDRIESVVASSEPVAGGGRLLYGLRGVRREHRLLSNMGNPIVWNIQEEIVVIDGRDGRILATATVPEIHPKAVRLDFSTSSANFSGHGKTDIVLREWRDDAGHGGFNVWAYDAEMNALWHRVVKTPYGHNQALQFYDVTGDGRDDLLAGGTLFDAQGNVLWVHDRAEEMDRIVSAGHYDSVAFGALSGEPDLDPVAFLVSGSAGVYVVDGRTGCTRMVHRFGHAQYDAGCKVRPDLPGTEVLISSRWGNYGIWNLLSGSGEWLWRRQPSFVGEIPTPVAVEWGDATYLWCYTQGTAQALYDGYGRKVKDLALLRRAWGERMSQHIRTGYYRMGTDPRPYLCLITDTHLYAFGPDL